MAETTSAGASRGMKIGIGAVVGVAALFFAWRMTRGNTVVEPPPSTFVPAVASSSAAASGSAAGGSSAGDPDDGVPGRDRPPKPQVYATALEPRQKFGMPLRPMDLEIFALIEKGEIKN